MTLTAHTARRKLAQSTLPQTATHHQAAPAARKNLLGKLIDKLADDKDAGTRSAQDTSAAAHAATPKDLDQIVALFLENPGCAVAEVHTHLTAKLRRGPTDSEVLCTAADVLEVLWADAVERRQFLVLSALARLRFLATSVATHGYAQWLPAFRSARVHWLDYLDNIDQDPWLSGRPGKDIEDDLDLLRDTLLPDTNHRGDSRVDDVTWLYYDRALARRLVDNHLLPRGDLGDSVRLIARYGSRKNTTASTALGKYRLGIMVGLPVLAAAALLILWVVAGWFGWPPWWAFAGDALCLLPAVAAVATLSAAEHNPLRTRLWLPRVLAGNVVGIATLVALHPDWWQTPIDGLPAVVAPVLLIAAAFAYQLHEFRNHGSTGRALYRRTALVTLISASYALLAGWLALRYVLPVFSEQGHLLAAVRGAAPWAEITLLPGPDPAQDPPHAMRPLWMLLTAAVWSHSIGVFVQLVWDDKPITAPLGRQPRG